MRISFHVEPDDIRRFLRALARARRAVRDADEIDILAGAKHALDRLPLATAPGYVRRRLTEVQRLIVMLEDDAWALPLRQREDVLRALVYFGDPDDMIPDHVEVIGLLDDAIMLELLLRDLRPVLRAYEDFLAFRKRMQASHGSAARIEQAAKLAARRTSLLARATRQQQAGASRRRATP